jgi:hypothetical protein
MIIYLIFSLVLFLATASLYISVMKLRELRDSGELNRAHWSLTVVAYTLLGVGLVCDMLLNWMVFTVVLLELPQEVLTTARVRRHKFTGTGWRQSVCIWFCTNFLKPFDANHCE